MFNVKEIVAAVSGRLLAGEESVEFNNFSKDTRTINKGDFYIPLSGENFDGHDYILSAVEKGSRGFFVANNYLGKEELIKKLKDSNKDIAIIEVEDTLIALQELAKYNRQKNRRTKVIAVTGSVGKTSTKEMISSVLEKEFKVLKTQGNLNNHIGLPLTLLKLDGEDVCVVEMGMNNSGEISLLSTIATPDIGIITNIGVAHIGNLGSQENIFKAKFEIIDGMSEGALLIVNGDDKFLRNLKSNANITVVKYGLENEEVDEKGSRLKIEGGRTSFSVGNEEFTINAVGRHNVYNALCAMAVGQKLGMSIENIRRGYLDYKNEKMRMQNIYLKNNILLINDAYNANYDSMKAGIESVGEIAAKRKIVVLGDMFELGEFSAGIHADIGELFEKNKADILITCGKDSAKISESASKYLGDVTFHYNDKKDAINKLIEIISKDDLVYFKASRGMKFEEIVDSIIKHFGGEND